MPRAINIFFIAAIPVTILAAIHYYLYVRLIRDAGLSRGWHLGLSVTLITLALCIPLAIIAARNMPSPWRTLLAWPGYAWMGTMFVLLVLVTVGDMTRAVVTLWFLITEPSSAVDPSRRIFLARALRIGTFVASLGLLPVAFASAIRSPYIQRITIPLQKLPRGLDGLMIAQLTDLHVGAMAGRAFIEDVVRRTNELKPDVIVITGDLVDGKVADLGPDVAPLAQLQAPYGTFFVTGNHEYYSGVEEWVSYLSSIGIRVLRNERVTLGEGDAVLDLAGVDDAGQRSEVGDLSPGGRIHTALAGADPNRELVLLAHQPKDVVPATVLGASLVLSGHTHGGQIWPFGLLVRLSQPYVSGLHLHEGKTWIYVSRGTGYWGPPMRLGNPPEITCVELRCAPQLS